MGDYFGDVSDYREQREAREAAEARRVREAESAADVHAATVEAAAAEFSRKARELGIPTSTREEYARGLWELHSNVCVNPKGPPYAVMGRWAGMGRQRKALDGRLLIAACDSYTTPGELAGRLVARMGSILRGE